MAERFPFVQLELAGLTGLEDGRYLCREPDYVLVVRTAGAPPPARRRLGRAKPKDADPEGEALTVPLTTLTAIRPEPLGDGDESKRWLERVRADGEVVEAELAAGLGVINRAVHAQRTATLDPHLPDVSIEHALAVRVGFGDGEALADGRFAAAIEVPRSQRQRRVEALRPQERVAGVLGGRESVPPSEELLLRARADLDAGRGREAALGLRVGLEALLAEPRSGIADEATEELAALEERKRITGEAANEALRGELSEPRIAELTETLRLCGRVLRRRRLG